MKKRVVIMGAGGRDFHDFNTCFRENESVNVVAFTAAQIPGIGNRWYPPDLAGRFYPDGIPILKEEDLGSIIKEHKIDECVFAYSDVPYSHVNSLAAKILALGANFTLIAAERTMLKSQKPIVAITAVRTGCGKSQTTRAVVNILKETGKRVVVIRHPMPYGNLAQQIIQRFEDPSDIIRHHCTTEEREEYGQHVENGAIVYAGVDYEFILDKAEREADVIVWDGGNNDTPFYKPDVWLCVADALRPGHEVSYYPGGNFIGADFIIINKCHGNKLRESIIERNAERLNPQAEILKAQSIVTVDNPELVLNKRVAVVEDGPTLTHGGMGFGAGAIAAAEHGAKVIDPRPYAVGSIAQAYEDFPHIGMAIPALGYSPEQESELQKTINSIPSGVCDTILFATPAGLDSLLPHTRVRYNLDGETIKSLRSLLVKKEML